jgi:hypothetical protein
MKKRVETNSNKRSANALAAKAAIDAAVATIAKNAI